MSGYRNFTYGSADDRVRLIREELNSLPTTKRDLGNKYQICCPFHNDTNPSALVGLDSTERAGPVGWMTCLGCGKSVGWNVLASALNLKKIGKPKVLTTEHFASPEAFKTELFDQVSGRTHFSELKELKAHSKFPFAKWRQVDVSLLKKVGARYVTHTGWGNMPFVFLPVNVQGKMRGYVKAKIEKPKDDKPSYLNAKADNGANWSRKWGLLYFDYAVKRMKRRGLKTMVLCEGPRDSLRYLKRDIPAVSVLGALNWTSHKRELLEDAGVEKLVLSFDGDDAGIMATKAVYKNTRQSFDVKYLALWNERIPLLDKHGVQKTKDRGDREILQWENELDPFNMPERFVDNVAGELV